ncbi:Rtt106p, partial [Ascoidea rubescens DSM 1968]
IDPTLIILKLSQLSFQSPLRKKMNLIFAVNPTSLTPFLSISTDFNKTNLQKTELILNDLNNDNIFFSSFLPVPEKKNLDYLIVFYKQNYLNKFNNDPILLTINKELMTKYLSTSYPDSFSTNDQDKENDSYRNFIIQQACLTGFRISDYKNAKLFYVEAFKKNKEGTLYFLQDYILFGFKKPILIFSSKDITSISYSSITRLTFNITLIIKDEEKIEFSMIDQSEFGKIDKYIKDKQVVDKSMADELKAK